MKYIIGPCSTIRFLRLTPPSGVNTMTVLPTVVVKSRKPETVLVTKLPPSIVTSSKSSSWPPSEEGGGVSNVADAETHQDKSYHDIMKDYALNKTTY